MMDTALNFVRSPPNKRPHTDSYSEFPPPLGSSFAARPPQISPVFIKLVDGGPNFKDLKVAEREAFYADLFNQVGELKDSQVMRGGVTRAHIPQSISRKPSLISQ